MYLCICNDAIVRLRQATSGTFRFFARSHKKDKHIIIQHNTVTVAIIIISESNAKKESTSTPCLILYTVLHWTHWQETCWTELSFSGCLAKADGEGAKRKYRFQYLCNFLLKVKCEVEK